MRAKLRRSGLAVLLIAGTIGCLAGQTIAAEGPPTLPDIYCFSGSPLLLQVNVPNSSRSLESVYIDSASSSASYRIPDIDDLDALQFYINPFLSPGVYDLDIAVQSYSGEIAQSHLDVGFVDFVWGRDNLSFGNNSEYESVIGSFGEVLSAWLVERFGEIDPGDMVLLVDYMYGLFGKNTGRCYAFSGMEVRYWRWPELLPSYYDSAHDLRGSAAYYQREMNFLQFDIVFDHFFAGPGAEQLRSSMNTEEMNAQLSLIEKRIAGGNPVAVGFAGPDLHHSMLVFGFIRNRTNQTVDLLVANNWKNDEKLNIHSRDAEIIRIFLSPDREGPKVEWRYDSGVRKREIDRLFAVDVKRDPYVHDRALLDAIITREREALFDESRAVLVVEGARGARIIDGERSTGWLRNRTSQDIEEVWYERVGEAIRFTYPAEADFTLEIADHGGARILEANPEEESGRVISSERVTDETEDNRLVVRLLPLGGKTVEEIPSNSDGPAGETP